MSKAYRNKESIYRGVVYHKIVERRMDSSAGGALVAFIESFIKEGGYFCAPAYDDSFHLRYLLSNDPNKIEDVIDGCITDCYFENCPEQIENLLEKDERVLFAGLPCHCNVLLRNLKRDYRNLVTIEIQCTGVSEDVLIDKYIKESETKHGDVIDGVHFHDKEFDYYNSKRITFKNGKTIYIYDKEPFDVLNEQKVFMKEKCRKCSLYGAANGIGDISIGEYGHDYKIGDNLGYSVVIINTSKGQELYDQAKRRLDIYKEGMDVNDNLIVKGTIPSFFFNNTVLDDHSLDECASMLLGKQKRILFRIKQFIIICLKELEISRMHPGPIFKFIKYNFMRKNTKINIEKLGVIFIAPYCEFYLAKDALIELDGPLYVGTEKRVPSSRLETRLWMRSRSKLIVHKRCIFAFGGDIEVFKDAVLDVGDLVTANPFTIICGERIEIGTPVNIAKNTEVRDTNSHLLSTNGYKLNRPITIGNHVWIASNCAVMPGTKIGDGCVISGVSYVNKKIPSFTISDGHPAEVKSTVKYFRM